MIFRNILFSAVVVGIIAGSIYGWFQQTRIAPIIQAAEQFEPAGSVTSPQADDAAGHAHHHGDGWAPADGSERSAFSLGSNIIIGIAFSLLLLPLMAMHDRMSGKHPVDALRGLGWGIAILLSLFVAPALFGLHPEVPGTVSADLAARQLWWALCALSTAAAIALMYYGRRAYKTAGIALLALPHLIGAPHSGELSFVTSEPAAVESLLALSTDFYVASAIGAVILCALVGTLSGFANRRFIGLSPAGDGALA